MAEDERHAIIEKMGEPSTANRHSHAEPPLWSIGLAMAVILGAPLVMYSFAPTGPLREGDTVFSDGQQQAHLTSPLPHWRTYPDGTCLLDPNSPLIIAHISDGQANPSIVAHVQGTQTDTWPFCPIHAEVRLDTHQVFQKPAVFGAVREILTRWSSNR